MPNYRKWIEEGCRYILALTARQRYVYTLPIEHEPGRRQMQITTQADRYHHLARLVHVIETYRYTEPDMAAAAKRQARAVARAIIAASNKEAN